MKYFFTVGTPSLDSQVNALSNTYMRLVEAATSEYRLGSEAFRRIWGNSSFLGVDGISRVVSHFEHCITDMHRAIGAYRRLKNHKTRDALSRYLANNKPKFNSENIARQIRGVRDAIHHMDERVADGLLADGQPMALRPNGIESPHPTEPGQTIKVFDRLAIAGIELMFRDLVAWLEEMQRVAARIAQYDRERPEGSSA